MSGTDLGNLAYLGLLGTVLVVWFVVQNRNSLGKMTQQAVAWVLIFVGVIAVFGLWEDIRQTVRPTQAVFADQGRVEVPRAPDGHYYLTLQVNDTPVRFVVDTGASNIVLSRTDAQRIGLKMDDLAFIGRAMTANGEVRTAPVDLDSVTLGPVEDHDMTAWVNEGEMDESLLGMTYLDRWSRIEIGSGQLILTR